MDASEPRKRFISFKRHSIRPPGLPLAAFAKDAGASERTVARQFVRETGLTFRQWRMRLRLLLSLTALEAGTSVTTAALDCGYDSPSAFIAAFRRLLGKTPGEFFS